MLLTLSGRSFIKIQFSSFQLFPMACPFRVATQLQYYIKLEKCKVNDVIFPSGCGARAINLGNKNVKIGIFTGGTSVRSKNIFTDISRYPTGKHEISYWYLFLYFLPFPKQFLVFMTIGKKAVKNIVSKGERERMLIAFSPFPTMFSTLSETFLLLF